MIHSRHLIIAVAAIALIGKAQAQEVSRAEYHRVALFNACVAGGIVGFLRTPEGSILTQSMAENLIAFCLNGSKAAADKATRKVQP